MVGSGGHHLGEQLIVGLGQGMYTQPGLAPGEHIVKGLIFRDIFVEFTGRGMVVNAAVKVTAYKVTGLCHLKAAAKGGIVGDGCCVVVFCGKPGINAFDEIGNGLDKFSHPLPFFGQQRGILGISGGIGRNRAADFCFPTGAAVGTVAGVLPKGHIEAGETDVQTALRELYEETGLTANLDTSRCASIEYPISSFARKQVAFFLGEVAGEPKVREGEIDKFKWVTAEELKDYLFPDTYEACKTLLR